MENDATKGQIKQVVNAAAVDDDFSSLDQAPK